VLTRAAVAAIETRLATAGTHTGQAS
jgi:hypothetical protein